MFDGRTDPLTNTGENFKVVAKAAPKGTAVAKAIHVAKFLYAASKCIPGGGKAGTNKVKTTNR